MSKPVLGRGLGALLGGPALVKAIPAEPPPAPGAGLVEPASPHERVQQLPLERIRPCPFQPRKEFSPEALQELADSIREQGIIQPLIVRPRDGGYELIAGERRWRAAQLVGLKEIPAIVREADDASVLELALIENLQRENLNPLEEALGYSQLIEQFHLRQEDVSSKVGKSRAVVANSLRLLKLPPEVQDHLRGGRVSVGHAKVVLGLATPGEQRLAAEGSKRQNLKICATEEVGRPCAEGSGRAGDWKCRCSTACQSRRAYRGLGNAAARASRRQSAVALSPGQRFARNPLFHRCRSGTHSRGRRGQARLTFHVSNFMIQPEEFREQCAVKLLNLIGKASHLRAFVGLDGFVDEIVHVVDKRENAEHFQRLSTIAALGERISTAAGKSTNIELVNQRTKLGGNGPIMANALAQLGVKVTYVGALGYPSLHPVFHDFAQHADVHSIAEAGHTDACEVRMLGEVMEDRVQ